MSKYTINDVANIIPVEQTQVVIDLVEDYLNNGKIPAYDPCLSCEPTHARKLIGLIQTAERTGMWPPKRSEVAKSRTAEDSKAELSNIIQDEGVAESVGKATAKTVNKDSAQE